MIEILVDFLKSLGWNPGFLRIFDYITFRVLMAALTALVAELLAGITLGLAMAGVYLLLAPAMREDE